MPTASTSPAAYDLRRLRLAGLITRIEHTNRYRLTPDGSKVAVLYTKVHNRLLRPLVAADQPRAPAELRAALKTINQHVAAYFADAVCLLDVPVSKTRTAFTKSVKPIVGQAIEAWQALRPGQPARLDRKTSEHVDLLFWVPRTSRREELINRTIIRALCRKAGVPTADVRGNSTSHRARSTIASQLYNAKEPMTLFELQAWLGTGRRPPPSTMRRSPRTP